MSTKLDSGLIAPDVNDDIIKTICDLAKNFNLLDLWHPVGSIFQCTKPVDPATLFGGTWTPLHDYVLFAESSSEPIGKTGGTKTHTHIKGATRTTSSPTVGAYVIGTGDVVNSAGTMMPYRSIYMWERTA